MSASLHLSLPPSPRILVLTRSALYLIHRALCPAVIECVHAAYPCNYLLLSRAIQHTQHSAQIDVIQYPTALFWLGGKTHICFLKVYSYTEQDILLLFTFKLVHSLQPLSAGGWLCRFVET